MPLPRIATPFSVNASVWEASQAKAIEWCAGERWKPFLSDADEEFLFDEQDDPLNLAIAVMIPRSLRFWKGSDTKSPAWMKTIGDRLPYFDKK